MLATIFSDESIFSLHLQKLLKKTNCNIHVSGQENDIPQETNYLFVILSTPTKISTKLSGPLNNNHIKSCIIVLNSSNKIDTIDFPKTPIIYIGNDADKELVSGEIVKKIFSFGFENKENFFGNQLPYKNLTKTKKEKITKNNKIYLRSILFLTTILFWFLTLPFLLIPISSSTLLLSYFLITQKNFPLANLSLHTTKLLSEVSYNELVSLSNLPLISEGFNLPKRVSAAEKEISEIGINSIDSYEILKNSFANSLNKKDYDLIKTKNNLLKNVQKINDNISSLENELSLIPYTKNFISKNEKSIGYIKSFLNLSENFLISAPSILGTEKPKTYLILFQNSSELRPTGGFVGSFALITFEKGKLFNLEVYDIYDADGQLKGHVDPPNPLRTYLKEGGWYFRDSNWNPDFPSSAKVAAWFLDKEMEIKVDGVVAVDSEFIISLLQKIGPINLPNSNLQITSQNFYEKINSQIENNFFPGSRNKSNLLSDLYKTLIQKVSTQGLSFESLARLSLNALSQRHIQIYFNDVPLQKTLSDLNWAGEIKKTSCFDCDNITISLVEANLGVNKVNPFIEREAFLSQKILDNFIENSLIVNFTNKNSTLAYKNYLRLITNKDTTFDGVLVQNQKITQTLIPELEEHDSNFTSAGVFVEINPKSQTSIKFSWKTKSLKDKKSFLIRKQAGLVDEPMTIKIENNKNLSYTSSLLEDFIYEYSKN
ncbi:MAG: DUF4012 domain-containing protein [Candidatus Woesebacteria bacterium]|nr:MAG: DUF4012 domain-containing protein [Candidatus Woesebacteria bacterium]